LQKILQKQGKILMGWDEIMTENMPKDAIIHSWRIVKDNQDPKQIEVAKNGYKTVLSSGYYIDLMFPAKDHYLNDPIPSGYDLTKEQEALIIGGEATMWSELVTPLTVDSRIWPRTAAIAERFWSARDIRDVTSMYNRMSLISNDLEQIGILHQRNKEVILRNITNYQDTEALEDLSNVSEPFKFYTRNSGGKQYKSFSPFTLFADACNVDAVDARKFNVLCASYLKSKDSGSKNEMLAYFSKWKNIHSKLLKISPQAPILKNVLPYAERISKISDLFESGLQNGKFSKKEYDKAIALLVAKEDPMQNLDVDFAVSESLKNLAEFLAK
jgi:hexosaminidase